MLLLYIYVICNSFNSSKYKGPDESDTKGDANSNAKSHSERVAAAIRANHPISSQCGLFYFEVDIIDKGKNGYCQIYYFFLYYN